MKSKQFLANSVLWAAAIIASAIVGAPAVLSTFLLPALWVGSLIVAGACRRRPENPVA